MDEENMMPYVSIAKQPNGLYCIFVECKLVARDLPPRAVIRYTLNKCIVCAWSKLAHPLDSSYILDYGDCSLEEYEDMGFDAEEVLTPRCSD